VTPPRIDATHCDAGQVTLPVNGITPGINFHALKIGDCNGSWQP
jgi:hypothetical protein